MTIRAIGPADLEEIWELNQANVPMVGSVDQGRMQYLVDACQYALLVEESSLDGFSLVFGPGSSYDSVNYQWFSDKRPGAYYLDRVAFRSGAQRQGLGTALYQHIEKLLVNDGAQELALEVNVDPPNLSSLRFHEHHGFVEVGQQQTPYGTTVSLQIKTLGK
jgi:predicted GNAT superfamily acetyltransferase